MSPSRLFNINIPIRHRISLGDTVVFFALVALTYGIVKLAVGAPAAIMGPKISLAPTALPYYTGLSLARMSAAYVLSMLFTLVYGYMATHYRRAEYILLPLLDVFQSIPILSFLPAVLLGMSAILPQSVAAEVASIILIFTSQVWNMTFAWYQSLTTVPKELREASTVFRFNGWLNFRTLELPFAAISLIWNSMMSWAGGWFFLMAAEIFTVGQRDFRLPGLGAYLSAAANEGDLKAVASGILTLILVIVILDQFVWRPLLAWSDRFSLSMTEGDNPPTSWFYDALRTSRFARWFTAAVLRPLAERVDAWFIRHLPAKPLSQRAAHPVQYLWYLVWAGFALALLYGLERTARMLLSVPLAEWMGIVFGVLATLLRVLAALAIALAWTVPLGVAIGTNRRVAAWLQPVVQIAASVPATALFPVFLLLVLGLPGGLNLAAVLLMLMGTQWYLLFNVIAGAAAIPQDLMYTAALLRLGRWERWRRLILPALLPSIITGSITAGGGAWNASIVAEHVEFGGRTLATTGIGAIIARATATGDYPLLLAATLSMITAVVTINRLVWRRLYHVAQEKYRLD